MASHETDGCAEEGGDETHEAATGEGYARAAGQPLLVLLQCGCPSRSPNAYSPMQYQINAGDTFWIVSTTKLQNLKQYQAVERVNPTLVPTNLGIGQIDMFPAACSPPFPAACSPPFVAAAWSPPSERCRCLVAGGRRQQHQTYPINSF
uniref:NFP second LysM domain-containing protein n=2 Tax=Oryza glaberrima TaxID=4538 RepID=I1PW85_ORYGL